MQHFKHLQQDGSGYLVKQYFSIQQAIMLSWLAISILVLVFSNQQKLGIGLLIFSLLMTVLAFLPVKNHIDPKTRKLTIFKGSARRQKQFNYEDIQGFELQSLYVLRVIPLGSFLYANIKGVPKAQRPAISQSFSKRTMQEVYNELEIVFSKEQD